MIDTQALIRNIATNMTNQLPYHRGTMRSSVKYGFAPNQKGVVGVITIDVPYANYVNYGFENHANSTKLKRDYMIVERIITRTIQASCKGVMVR